MSENTKTFDFPQTQLNIPQIERYFGSGWCSSWINATPNSKNNYKVGPQSKIYLSHRFGLYGGGGEYSVVLGLKEYFFPYRLIWCYDSGWWGNDSKEDVLTSLTYLQSKYEFEKITGYFELKP